MAPTAEQAFAAPSATVSIAEEPRHANTNSAPVSVPENKLTADENMMPDNAGKLATDASFNERSLAFWQSRQGSALMVDLLTPVVAQKAESMNCHLNLKQMSPEEIEALIKAQKRIDPTFDEELFRNLHGLGSSALDRTAWITHSKTLFQGKDVLGRGI